MFISYINLILTHYQPTLPLLEGSLLSRPALCKAMSPAWPGLRLFGAAAPPWLIEGFLMWPGMAPASPLSHFLCVPGRDTQGTAEPGCESCTRDFWPRTQLRGKNFGRGSFFQRHAQKMWPPTYGTDLGWLKNAWLVITEKKHPWLCDHVSTFGDSSILLTIGSLAICVRTVRPLYPQCSLSKSSQPVVSFLPIQQPCRDSRFYFPHFPGGKSPQSF